MPFNSLSAKVMASVLHVEWPQKHFDFSLWTEAPISQWNLEGTTAEETFTRGRRSLRSLRLSPPPTPLLLPHLSSREKFIRDVGRNHFAGLRGGSRPGWNRRKRETIVAER